MLGFVLGCFFIRVADRILQAAAEPVAANQIHEQKKISMEDFLDALASVESNRNDRAVGDRGKALGRYQIHKVYWQDATEHDRSIGGSYENVTDPDYATKVVLAYFNRYGKDLVAASDWESLARMHNGGPAIFRKKGTKAWENTSSYWCKVQAKLNGN